MIPGIADAEQSQAHRRHTYFSVRLASSGVSVMNGDGRGIFRSFQQPVAGSRSFFRFPGESVSFKIQQEIYQLA